MGVKLQDLIHPEPVDFSKLACRIIAIDAPNIIMGLFNFALKTPQSESTPLITDRTQRAISHLYGILYRVTFYYSKKIFPIFCFDGRDSPLKRLITKDRLADFRFTKLRYKKAMEQDDRSLAKKISLSSEYLWPNILDESRALLGAIGVPYIDSPASAESQCAELVKRGIAHYSNSHDLDSLLFGCPRVIQNLSKSLKRKQQNRWLYTKIVPREISLKKSLQSMNLSQFQLIDLALLIGSDYFKGIEGIGPKKALELIKRHHTLERVLSKERHQYDFSSLSSERIQEVRKIFLFPEVIHHPDSLHLHWNFPNLSRLFSLLCEDHNLNRERVEKNVRELIGQYQRCKIYFSTPRKVQTSLHSYF